MSCCVASIVLSPHPKWPCCNPMWPCCNPKWPCCTPASMLFWPTCAVSMICLLATASCSLSKLSQSDRAYLDLPKAMQQIIHARESRAGRSMTWNVKSNLGTTVAWFRRPHEVCGDASIAPMHILSMQKLMRPCQRELTVSQPVMYGIDRAECGTYKSFLKL